MLTNCNIVVTWYLYILKELEKERLEKTSELDKNRQQLEAAEALLAQEQHAVQLMREQLDKAKVFAVVIV